MLEPVKLALSAIRKFLSGYWKDLNTPSMLPRDQTQYWRLF